MATEAKGPQKTSVLVIGTDYVGGSVIDTLCNRRDRDLFEISALTANPTEAGRLEEMGVRPVIAGLDDLAVLKSEVARHIVTINCSDPSLLFTAEVILQGINERPNKAAYPVVYIHTSCADVLSDDSEGNKTSSKVYFDTTPSDIDELPMSQPHKNVDSLVAQAARDNKNNAFVGIMILPTVYGVGTGPFKRTSMQIPALVRSALKRGYVGQVGRGLAAWEHVHIKELCDAYMVLMDSFLNGNPNAQKGHGDSVYFFAESGEHTWAEVSQKIADCLQERSAISDLTVRPFPDQVLEEDFWGKDKSKRLLGGNARHTAGRLRLLDWHPESAVGRPHILDHIEDVVKAVLEDEDVVSSATDPINK